MQKGTENSDDSLLNDLALALRFIFVTAKGRLVSHFFSVSQAIRALLRGFLRILDIIIGIPSLQAHNLDAKIREERNKYLVAELLCRVSKSNNFLNFGRLVTSVPKCVRKQCPANLKDLKILEYSRNLKTCL